MRLESQSGRSPARRSSSSSPGPVVIIRRDSGRRDGHGTTSWRVAFEPKSERKFDPLEGWMTTYDRFSSINLEFRSLQDALACVEARGWRYRLYE